MKGGRLIVCPPLLCSRRMIILQFSLRDFLFWNGVLILEAELRELWNNVRELNAPEASSELKAIKCILEV